MFLQSLPCQGRESPHRPRCRAPRETTVAGIQRKAYYRIRCHSRYLHHKDRMQKEDEEGLTKWPSVYFTDISDYF